jgi:hypothetical protein
LAQFLECAVAGGFERLAEFALGGWAGELGFELGKAGSGGVDEVGGYVEVVV